ncbi:COG2426 family protein [Fusibacter sp. JL216-2]|uniref:COG2426 family protein n=1 Tax=Fusibacter sp. JL216-2 TaxID=3071453 RepID=UPI003D32CB9A
MDLMQLLLKEFKLLLLAAMPIIELRGAIPAGMVMGLDPLTSATISFIGSMLPVPFILFGMKPVLEFMRRFKWAEKFLDWIVNRTVKRAKNFDKYSFYGLMLFVAVPLPTTGVWTGSMAASIFGMKVKRSFFAILLGNLIAAFVITAGSTFAASIFEKIPLL